MITLDTSLAPGYIRMTYDGSLFPHHMVCPVNISGTPTPGAEPDLTLKDLSTQAASAAWSDYVDLMLPFYNTSINFGLAEIHTVDPDTGEDQFIFAWNVDKVGVSITATVIAAQAVFSFKTTLGTAYKLYLMESILPVNTKELPPFVDAGPTDLADYVTGDSSLVYGRGNAYPFAVLSLITKTNDKLRKQRGLA